MKVFAAILALSLSATAFGQSIDPSETSFAWKNGPDRDAVYDMAEHTNTVHVFEAYALFCSWCNRNASQVKDMANEFADNERVQFIDLGLDSEDRDFQRWISTHNPPFPVVQDSGHRVFNTLKQARGIPQTFVVDCAGNLVDHTVGYWGAAEKRTIRNAIATALETTCE